jgi:hypothetical protein
MEKKSVGLLELETAVLECFLEKTPLSPLGVNLVLIKRFLVNMTLLKTYLVKLARIELTNVESG